jgi:hypothetical protein
MTPKHTIESLTRLISKKVEPPLADAVLDALKRIEGQLITTRVLDKLPGGRVEWRLSRALGFTEIRNRSFMTSQGSSLDGICLKLAKSEASVPVDAAWIERENVNHYAGRRERNARRATALADTAMLSRLAQVMNDIEEITERLRVAKATLCDFTQEGTPLYPERYDVERACGLR